MTCVGGVDQRQQLARRVGRARWAVRSPSARACSSALSRRTGRVARCTTTTATSAITADQQRLAPAACRAGSCAPACRAAPAFRPPGSPPCRARCALATGCSSTATRTGSPRNTVVVEVDQRRVGRPGRECVPRQNGSSAKPDTSSPSQAGDPVEHAALVVGLEGFQRGIGHRDAQPRLSS